VKRDLQKRPINESHIKGPLISVTSVPCHTSHLFDLNAQKRVLFTATACVCVGEWSHGPNLSIHIFIDVYTYVYVHILQMFDLNAQKRVLSTATACVCVGGWTHGLNLYIYTYSCMYIYIY